MDTEGKPEGLHEPRAFVKSQRIVCAAMHDRSIEHFGESRLMHLRNENKRRLAAGEPLLEYKPESEIDVARRRMRVIELLLEKEYNGDIEAAWPWPLSTDVF